MEIQRYRKRSVSGEVLVEAVCLTPENAGDVANWCNAQLIEEKDAITEEKFDALNVTTPSGRKRVQLGDYVVCIAGHFLKASASDFDRLYEPIGNPHTPRPRSEVLDMTTTNPWEGIPRASQ